MNTIIYNNCFGTCKVVIKGDSIAIYATKKLSENRTFTKEGDLIDRGIILKHKSGKWIIGKTKKDIYAKKIGVDGPAILNFTKKQYWTFQYFFLYNFHTILRMLRGSHT